MTRTGQAQHPIEVDAARVRAFAEAIDWPCETVPPTWPISLLPDSDAAVDFMQTVAKNNQLLLHVSQSFRFTRPLAMAETMMLSVSAVGMDSSAPTLRIVLYDGAGEQVCLADTRMAVLDAIPAAKPGREADSSLGEPLKTRRLDTMTIDCFRAYQQASGDTNPVHHDHAYARALGLEGPIAPGMLVLGLLAGVAAQAADGASLTRLSMIFTAPLFAGQSLGLSAHGGGTPGRMTLIATDGANRLIGKGQAQF